MPPHSCQVPRITGALGVRALLRTRRLYAAHRVAVQKFTLYLIGKQCSSRFSLADSPCTYMGVQPAFYLCAGMAILGAMLLSWARGLCPSMSLQVLASASADLLVACKIVTFCVLSRLGLLHGWELPVAGASCQEMGPI